MLLNNFNILNLQGMEGKVNIYVRIFKGMGVVMGENTGIFQIYCMPQLLSNLTSPELKFPDQSQQETWKA